MIFSLIWSFLSGNAGSLLKTALDYFAAKNNVDLAEVQAAVGSLDHVAVAALNANVQAATVQAASICAQHLPVPVSSPAVRCARCSRRSVSRTWWRSRSARRIPTTWFAPRSTR